jgi:AraC-like DNA-binding protein
MIGHLRDTVLLPDRLMQPDLPIQVAWSGYGRVFQHRITRCPPHMTALNFIVRGRGRYDAGAWGCTAETGTITCMPPGLPFTFASDAGGYEWWWLNAAGPAVPGFLSAAGFAPGRACIPLPADSPVPLRMRRIHALLRRQAPDFATLAAAEVCALFLDIRRALAPGDAERTALLRVLDHRCPGVAAAARSLGLSEHQLSRRCRKLLGMAPWQWVMQRRMEFAAELLHDPEQSIARIAAATGMADAAHLTRVFRRRMGCTPARYRANIV